MKLVVAEKPSVAMSIAVSPGNVNRGPGKKEIFFFGCT